MATQLFTNALKGEYDQPSGTGPASLVDLHKTCCEIDLRLLMADAGVIVNILDTTLEVLFYNGSPSYATTFNFGPYSSQEDAEANVAELLWQIENGDSNGWPYTFILGDSFFKVNTVELAPGAFYIDFLGLYNVTGQNWASIDGLISGGGYVVTRLFLICAVVEVDATGTWISETFVRQWGYEPKFLNLLL